MPDKCLDDQLQSDQFQVVYEAHGSSYKITVSITVLSEMLI